MKHKYESFILFKEFHRGGFHYFITFTDDFSRFEYVYLMKHKSESFTCSRNFKMN